MFLLRSNIAAHFVKDKDLIGSQDPYFTMELSGDIVTTSVSPCKLQRFLYTLPAFPYAGESHTRGGAASLQRLTCLHPYAANIETYHSAHELHTKTVIDAAVSVKRCRCRSRVGPTARGLRRRATASTTAASTPTSASRGGTRTLCCATLCSVRQFCRCPVRSLLTAHLCSPLQHGTRLF